MNRQDPRASRRLAAMRRVQDEAIGLFEREGFGAVTMEDVARAAGVGVASVYRYFGTKEGLVLWDEYDPGLLEAVSAELAAHAPVAAVRRALGAQVGAVYTRDKARILRRADLIAATPALTAAARLGTHGLRAGFAGVLAPHVADRLRREVIAAAVVSTLEVAVEEWRRARGRMSLARVLERAFAALERL